MPVQQGTTSDVLLTFKGIEYIFRYILVFLQKNIFLIVQACVAGALTMLCTSITGSAVLASSCVAGVAILLTKFPKLHNILHIDLGIVFMATFFGMTSPGSLFDGESFAYFTKVAGFLIGASMLSICVLDIIHTTKIGTVVCKLFGGRLGFVAFVSGCCMVLLLHGNMTIVVPHISDFFMDFLYNPQHLFALGIGPVALRITAVLKSTKGLHAVTASALVGGSAALIQLVLQYKGIDVGPIDLLAFSGSFVGMSDTQEFHFEHLKNAMRISPLFLVVYALLVKTVPGVGGMLGTIAFVSVFLYKLGCIGLAEVKSLGAYVVAQHAESKN